MSHPPFRLKDGWYCIVDDVRHGPWTEYGYALGGYQTELRRAERREQERHAAMNNQT